MTGRALSFGNVAEAYELGRPEWPAAAVDRPAAALGLSRSAREAIFLRAGSRGGLRYQSDKWREAFTGSRFEPLTEERFAREVELTREQTAALWLTVSTVASLPDDERDAVARELHAALAPSYLLTEQVYLFWTRARQPR